jgi:hypothetical protein
MGGIRTCTPRAKPRRTSCAPEQQDEGDTMAENMTPRFWLLGWAFNRQGVVAKYEDFERVTCPMNKGHSRPGKRIGMLSVSGAPTVVKRDFVWVWGPEVLVSQRMLDIFDKHRVIGFEVKPVKVLAPQKEPRTAARAVRARGRRLGRRRRGGCGSEIEVLVSRVPTQNLHHCRAEPSHRCRAMGRKRCLHGVAAAALSFRQRSPGGYSSTRASFRSEAHSRLRESNGAGRQCHPGLFEVLHAGGSRPRARRAIRAFKLACRASISWTSAVAVWDPARRSLKYRRSRRLLVRCGDQPHRSISFLPRAQLPNTVPQCSKVLMSLTRRRFAQGSAALAAAANVPTRPATGQGTLKVRRSVGDLIREQSPLIESYRRASTS